MRRLLLLLAPVIAITFSCLAIAEDDGFIDLFDGKSLDGWKIAENPKAFTVKDGSIVVNGTRGHMFYDGKVKDANFKNFHLKAEVMTKPKANSGIYIHTKFQENGWPRVGYEAQVANTHGDSKKTGSIYNVETVNPAPVGDNEWFTYEIIVKGKNIVTKINGKELVNHTEPDSPNPPKGWEKRVLSSGTFAIQAHDPGSTVLYRKFQVKPLDD